MRKKPTSKGINEKISKYHLGRVGAGNWRKCFIKSDPKESHKIRSVGTLPGPVYLPSHEKPIQNQTTNSCTVGKFIPVPYHGSVMGIEPKLPNLESQITCFWLLPQTPTPGGFFCNPNAHLLAHLLFGSLCLKTKTNTPKKAGWAFSTKKTQPSTLKSGKKKTHCHKVTKSQHLTLSGRRWVSPLFWALVFSLG